MRPPWGGTLATHPSMILSRACCTPSPDTSRVMDGLGLFLATLSISSMYMTPCSARLTSKSAACIRRSRMFSTSSPTYPASVRDVASAMAKGTSSTLASVSASRVLPEPAGPVRRMFDLCSSTSVVFWLDQTRL